jgi:hypothetical protein
MSFFVLSALASISFALVMILSSAALTVALAVTVVATAALDRQYNLVPMTLFIAAGVVTLGYRLIADPGLEWAMDDATNFEILLAYGGVLAALIASLWMLRNKERATANIMLDSAAWAIVDDTGAYGVGRDLCWDWLGCAGTGCNLVFSAVDGPIHEGCRPAVV